MVSVKSEIEGQGADIYRRYGQEHYDQLLFSKHRMTHEGICETRKSSTTLLNEEVVRCNVLAIDCHMLVMLEHWEEEQRHTGDTLWRE